MFSPLLDRLHKIYTGYEIYVPTAVFALMEGWLRGRSRYSHNAFTWKGKEIIPYEEDKILEAYQATPIHVPERILEKSVVVEFSLEEPEDLEILREVKTEPVVKPQTAPTERFGRRAGTKTKSFKNLF
jgi:hypothetical protein